MDKDALKRLQVIPGIGPSMAADLISLGYRSVPELKGQDPEAMYARLMEQMGCHVDRCVLYVFRCAVYFASNKRHDPEKLKWWSWKE
ncbi:helix-hairpin-helix domain-containing protein [Pseudodesulfovibrio sp.]|uniref:helix-hairpin-helix domain-containing protein n=1 Tax=unclassified Pseudodesulfovibrio TaxID=2661612 RepID=UPI003B009F25